jgi:YwiC-like protein
MPVHVASPRTARLWLRTRRRSSFVPSIVAYSAAAAIPGIPPLVLEPRLILVVVVMVPPGALTLAAARPGTPRELVLSLAHVAQASVLTPAAMLLAGETRPWVLGAATAIVAAEMAGSVLAVRSVIRERDNVAFAVRSVGYHAAIAVAAAVVLPLTYAALATLRTVRAATLPLARRRLRPVDVGVVEAVARSAPHVSRPSACGRVGRCARSARSADLRSDRPTADQPAERVVAARSGTSRMRSTLRSVWEVRVLSPRPNDITLGLAESARCHRWTVAAARVNRDLEAPVRLALVDDDVLAPPSRADDPAHVHDE